MKTAIRLLFAGVACGATCLAFGASKARTYSVVGFFEGRKPAQKLVDKAAVEIGRKMKDCTALPADTETDQVVQVLFKRDGTYRIYWDSLPLEGVSKGETLERYQHRVMLAFEMSRENLEGHGRAK